MLELKEYISTTFPGLVFKPSLYQQSKIMIDFELAKGISQVKSGSGELNSDYFNQVYV